MSHRNVGTRRAALLEREMPIWLHGTSHPYIHSLNGKIIYRTRMKKGVLLLLCQLLTLTALAQDLRSGFLNPPQEARPRVWWHWMNGNITRDGIRKDIEWMHRAGIGGFHCFDAGMGMKPVVEQRLDYMSEPWKDAFRLAVRMADSLGMEVAVASCPGWSNTGGPWVRPEQAMKRLVWTETIVKGGRKQSVVLPMPKHDRWYDDISVLALRLPDNDKTLEEMGGQITVSRESNEKNGPCTILCTFPQPQTIKALSISDGRYRSIWAALPAPVDKYLEASDDQRRWHVVPPRVRDSSWQRLLANHQHSANHGALFPCGRPARPTDARTETLRHCPHRPCRREGWLCLATRFERPSHAGFSGRRRDADRCRRCNATHGC